MMASNGCRWTWPGVACAHLVFLLLVIFPSALAIPHNSHALADPDVVGPSPLASRQNNGATKPFLLRIMPLGASITAGVGTHPQDARLAWNGYRKPLRDQLRWRGWAVNMVGSGADGDAAAFHNRQHEGHPGFVVANMTTVADNTIARKPNVVLINCGTNDAAYSGAKQPLVYTTGTRMRGVLNHLFDKIEGVTVVLSTLLPRKDSSNANVNIINPQYRELYAEFAAAGHKIVLAELNSNNLLDPNTDYRDNIHPNVGGAAKVAAVWDLAILEAERKGFLSPPANTGRPDYSPDGSNDNTSCELAKGGTASLRGPVRTQQGWGYDDGSYVHAEPGDANYRDVTPYFYKLESSFNWDTNSLAFAQLVNVNHVLPGAGERDDLVHCNDTDTGPSSPFAVCIMILNVDGYVNEEPVQLNTGLQCHARGIRWGDVNGDGLDDFICINAAGNMYVALNRGGNPPEFEPAADGGLIRTGEPWCSQDRVRLGDMDGDGRLDYCCIDGQGDIYCWRNGGQGDTPTAADGGYWQSLVPGAPTFLAQHESEGVAGVHLVDINGDHRSDWVYVYKDGSTKIFINQRGSYDDDGPGLRPHWARATAEHPALSALQQGRTSGIIFGRVDGTGRADRVVLYHSANDLSLGYYITLQAYKNNGHGGTKRKGDGVFYCDMFGRGRDDYLWVLSTGEITLFENIQSPPNWGQHGVIIDINRDRKSIHFGDWDGDGKCDILSVDRESGYVDMWRNKYRAGDRSPTFEAPKTVVGSGALGSSVRLCHEGWGWGLYDQGVRFADLDGDGRVDYICMEPDGRSIGHLNKADDFEFKGQIKFAPSEHLDRANFKWADVTGDGKADLIWVNKFNGAARVWKNGGFTPAGGSSMTWIDQGFLFKGHGRGQNIHFPILGHEGRADYHDVYPGTALANTWFNECPSSNGEGVDDYLVPIDPHLPSVPGSGSSDGGSTATTRIIVPTQITVTETFTGLIQQTIGPASPGDIFEYDVDDDTDRTIQVGLVGSPENFPDINCGVHFVDGPNGNTLSCIAEDVSWLFYSINQLGGPVATNPDPVKRRHALQRETREAGPAPTARRTVNHKLHDKWKPRGACSTVHCMLSTTAPRDIWVPVAQGTSSDGRAYEHHVVQAAGGVVGHRIHRGQASSNNSTNVSSSSSSSAEESGLARRQYEFLAGGLAIAIYFAAVDQHLKLHDWYTMGQPGTELVVSEALGAATERTVAVTNYHDLCIGWGRDDGQLGGHAFADMIYNNSPTPPMTFDQIQSNLKKCAEYLDEDEEDVELVCYLNATMVDEELAVDEDELDDDNVGPLPDQDEDKFKRSRLDPENTVSWARLRARAWAVFLDILLPKRTATSGGRNTYYIRDLTGGTGRRLAFNTPTYPNGENGQSLDDTKNNGDTAAYAMLNPRNCEDTRITDQANTDRSTPDHVNVASEHIVERQEARNFFNFVQRPQMDVADGSGLPMNCPNSPPNIPFDLLDRWASKPYRDWANDPTLPSGFPINLLPSDGSSFFSQMADALGSSTNPTVMVNLETGLNSIKARIVNTDVQPTAERKWTPFLTNLPNKQKAESALTLLTRGFGVFNYLNDDHVLDLTAEIYKSARDAARQFDMLMGRILSTGPTFSGDLLDCFLRLLAQRMTNVHKAYVNRRLDQLKNAWVVVLNSTRDRKTKLLAQRVINRADSLRRKISTDIKYNADDYINRP